MPNFKEWAYFQQRQWGRKVRRKKEIFFWAEKIRNKFLKQHDIRWATEQERTADEKPITYPLREVSVKVLWSNSYPHKACMSTKGKHLDRKMTEPIWHSVEYNLLFLSVFKNDSTIVKCLRNEIRNLSHWGISQHNTR